MRDAICGSAIGDFSRFGVAAVDVVEPQDVALAEIAADLHLDQLQRDLAGIGEAMQLDSHTPCWQ
jgi:hypothetical protein